MTTTRAEAIPGDHIHISTNPISEPFWQAAKENRLDVPRCADCGTFRMPPTPFCPQCQSERVDWTTLSGRAVVYSFAIVNRSPFPDVPDFTYVPAVVDLPDAVPARLVSNVIDADVDDIHIGMELQVDFLPIADGWKVPVFRPA
jgi:uncharacterized OB-fold protein